MRRGFTLIELLVVIAIIAILAVVVVLTLNPAELLRQGRDSNRVSDMSTLNEGVNLYNTDQGGASGYSLGSPNTVYVSIPDPNATTTAGTNCSSLGLPTLPSTYTYHCAGPNYYRNVNGTGWIPVNFSNISAGSPLSSLPVDPINSSSSRLYYSYTTNGSQFEVTAAMESAKYQVGGSNDVISTDGGPLASVYEKGSELGLEPLDYGDPTLVGWWPLTEGAGTTAYDDSGNNATGSWSGTPAGTSGYYSAGKVGAWAGTFDGSTDYVNVPNNSALNVGAAGTFCLWINPNSSWGGWVIMLQKYVGYRIQQYEETNSLAFTDNSGHILNGGTMTPGAWNHICVSVNNGLGIGYINGSQVFSGTMSNPLPPNGNPLYIGGIAGSYFPGLIDDVRIYNRALSAAQIAAMYAGGK